MIKHWAKLSCLVLCGQLVATACTTDNDEDDGGSGPSTSSGGSSSGGSSTGGTSSGGSAGDANGGSAGDPTTTDAGGTGGTGGTASGGSAGQAGSAGAAGASTEGYDGEQISDIAGPETVTNGGTFTVQVTIPGADEEQTFQVAVNGGAAENVTATPNDDGVFDIGFTVPDDADGDTVTATITPLDGDGDAGETEEFEADLIETGSGDVKVTLSFDQNVDLDLYVMEPPNDDYPDGFIISHTDPESPSGGELDLDSNRACNIDGINIENIFWPADAAAEGEYRVAVDFYEACVEETVNYTVTITIGDDVETIIGSFEPEVAGTEDSLREVGSFIVD